MLGQVSLKTAVLHWPVNLVLIEMGRVHSMWMIPMAIASRLFIIRLLVSPRNCAFSRESAGVVKCFFEGAFAHRLQVDGAYDGGRILLLSRSRIPVMLLPLAPFQLLA